MIVFNFGPFSKDELTIRFDAEGGRDFMSAILHICSQKDGEEVIDCFKYYKKSVSAAKIRMKKYEQDRLEEERGGLLFYISDDALEYAKFLLEKFLENGDFSPAEFWSFSRKERKYDTQVFFLKFSSADLFGA